MYSFVCVRESRVSDFEHYLNKEGYGHRCPELIDHANLERLEINNATVDNSKVGNACIESVDVEDLVILASKFDQVFVDGCEFYESGFLFDDFTDCRFTHCTFDGCSFEDVVLSDDQLEQLGAYRIPEEEEICDVETGWDTMVPRSDCGNCRICGEG